MCDRRILYLRFPKKYNSMTLLNQKITIHNGGSRTNTCKARNIHITQPHIHALTTPKTGAIPALLSALTTTLRHAADRVRQADEEEAEEEAVRKAAEVAATRAAVLASLSAPNQEQHSGLLSAVPDRVLEYLGRHRDQQLMRHPAYLLPKALTLREEPSMATAAAAVAFMPVKVCPVCK